MTPARANAKETSESLTRIRIFAFTHPKIHRGGSLICFLLVTMLDHKKNSTSGKIFIEQLADCILLQRYATLSVKMAARVSDEIDVRVRAAIPAFSVKLEW